MFVGPFHGSSSPSANALQIASVLYLLMFAVADSQYLKESDDDPI
jgi:hypothetical protein